MPTFARSARRQRRWPIPSLRRLLGRARVRPRRAGALPHEEAEVLAIETTGENFVAPIRERGNVRASVVQIGACARAGARGPRFGGTVPRVAHAWRTCFSRLVIAIEDTMVETVVAGGTATPAEPFRQARVASAGVGRPMP
jgi:hypothetical protein